MNTPALRLFVLVALALPTSAAWAQSRSDSVYIEDRLNQLQQSLTMLTGQLEQLQYQNQQLQQQMEKMQADYEYRLDALEKGKGGGASRPGPAPPAAPPRGAPAASNANADQLYHDAFKLLQDGDYAGAEKAFKTFVQSNPRHVL